MISLLHVKNYILIKEATIDFKNGFTAISGETGAGKSLFIDCVNLLTGAKTKGDCVRRGEEKAIIEGVFTNYNPVIDEILKNNDLDIMDELIIRRDITNSNRSIFRVNSLVTTVNVVEEIASFLVDIHTQHDTMKLFNQHNYLEFIDNNEIKEQVALYQTQLVEYKTNLKNYRDLLDFKDEAITELDFKKYQYDELAKANLKAGEVEDIERELELLNNSEKIASIKQDILTYLDNDTMDNLYYALSSIDKLASFDEDTIELKNQFNDSYYQIVDIKHQIKQKRFEFDERYFDELNERSSFLRSLTKKYKRSIEELIAFKEQLAKEIDNYENIDYLINQKRKEVMDSYNTVKASALSISSIRKNQARTLESVIKEELKELLLENTIFNISFNQVNLNDALNDKVFKTNGIDEVDFLISFNVGEAPKPLSKVASGGELSRVMLALKSYLVLNLNLSTMIFDEIDTGISRHSALRVGKVLKDLSNKVQVIAISHSPLVLSYATNHLLISKTNTTDETIVNITELDYDKRIEELTTMLNPQAVDIDSVRKTAIELLENRK